MTTDLELLPPSGRPEQLLILLHGVGASPAAMAPLAQLLRSKFAQSAVLVPAGFDAFDMGRPGRQWFSLQGLTEDNRVRARASTLTNLRLSYKIGPDARWMLDVFTLFDREADDIQYVEASRLRGEAEAVADRHVHPAEPRNLRLTLQASF